MPTIFEPQDLPVIQKNGVTIATLANQKLLGTDALQVQRIVLEANAKLPVYAAVDAERFVYVIRGQGRASVGQQFFPLEAESVLWLEAGDSFALEAGPDGLEVLFCQAPASE